MTELARYEPSTAAAPVAVSDLPASVSALAEWAQSAGAAYQLAEKLCQTSFVPEAFRGKPEEGAAAILAGAEAGLSPMAALRSYDVIQGTAAPRAIALRAIVQSQGHEVWVEESTDTRAVVKGRRKGSQQVQQSVWTMDRAKKLSLVNKHNWKNQPGAMLVARATSELCRLLASDAILGIGYAIEEMDDYDAEPSTVAGGTAKKATTRRTAKRASSEPKAPTPPAEPDLDEPAATEQSAEEVSDGTDVFTPITEAQLKKLQVNLRAYGITDRDAGLAYYEDVIGREVGSSKELSKDEASRIIDQLENELAEPTLDPAGDPPLDPAEAT